MILDESLYDSLSAQAKSSPRLRMSLDLRTSESDSSQRILNAVEPGTEVPIHRHQTSAETCLVLRGSLESIRYNDAGEETHRYTLEKGCGCQIPLGQWHTINVLEPGTIIFEGKDGPYHPITPIDQQK